MHPFYSKKYYLNNHKNYKYLADANEENKYSFAKAREIETEKSSESEREKILEHYNLKDFELEQEQLERLFFSSPEEEKEEIIDELNEAIEIVNIKESK